MLTEYLRVGIMDTFDTYYVDVLHKTEEDLFALVPMSFKVTKVQILQSMFTQYLKIGIMGT